MIQTLDHLYNLIKHTLKKNGFEVNPYREIETGLSFLVSLENFKSLITLTFTNEKISFSLDQKTHPILKSQLHALITPHIDNLGKLLTFSPEIITEPSAPKIEPNDLLGMATTGHENIFGPIVECGVVMSEKSRHIFADLNLNNYKQWTFQHLQYVVSIIQKHCAFSHIIMNPDSFNEVYKNINNIYHMISWLQLRTIENIRRQSSITHATSKFLGQKSLIESKLLLKGYSMVLFESAKSNFLAPLAAEVFAHYLLLTSLKKISKTFNLTISSGNFEENRETINEFLKNHTEEDLQLITKAHLLPKEKI